MKARNVICILALLCIGVWVSLHFEEPILNFLSISEDLFVLLLISIVGVALMALLMISICSKGGDDRGSYSEKRNDSSSDSGIESPISIMTDGHIGIKVGGSSVDTSDGSIGINMGGGISDNGFNF